MSDRTTTLSEVIRAASAEAAANPQKPEGVWADQFDVIVKRGEGPNGNKPSKASVYDPTNGQEGTLVWFGGDLRDFENKTIRIGGKGNKAKEYRGKVEISVGKNGRIDVIGPAPAGGQPSHVAPNDKTSAGGNQPPQNQTKPKVDPVTYFHREMSRQSLAYLHCFQYATDIRSKAKEVLKIEMPLEQFQATISSLYIQGNKDGLFAKVPKLRELDADGKPLKFLPPQPDPAALEAERLRKEAAEEAERKAREAEELARKARAHPPQNEELDEDVPF